MLNKRSKLYKLFRLSAIHEAIAEKAEFSLKVTKDEANLRDEASLM